MSIIHLIIGITIILISKEICLLQVIGYWITMSVISFTLVGLLFWELMSHIAVKSVDVGSENRILSEQKNNMLGAGNLLMCIFILLVIGYFILLFQVWGWEMTLVGFILMAQRIPDLYYKNSPTSKNIVWHTVSFVLWLITLPIIWYSICL
jgi:hypothetical protein